MILALELAYLNSTRLDGHGIGDGKLDSFPCSIAFTWSETIPRQHPLYCLLRHRALLYPRISPSPAHHRRLQHKQSSVGPPFLNRRAHRPYMALSRPSWAPPPATCRPSWAHPPARAVPPSLPLRRQANHPSRAPSLPASAPPCHTYLATSLSTKASYHHTFLRLLAGHPLSVSLRRWAHRSKPCNMMT
jgi:hypothetical protein